MKIGYKPPWHKISRGTVICLTLGIVAGLSVPFFRYGYAIAGLLAVVGGIYRDRATPIEGAGVFLGGLLIGLFPIAMLPEGSLGQGLAMNWLMPTPFQLVYIIPLHFVGSIIGLGLRRYYTKKAEPADDGVRDK
jgi:hypothetical protein